MALECAFGAEQAAPAGKAIDRVTGRCSRLAVAGVGAVAGDGGAAAEFVGIHVDRNHDPGAERSRCRNRHRIDQRAIDQPAAAEMDRRENAWQRVGGAQRQDQRAARQPDFVAGPDLGGDRREADRQILNCGVADRFFQAVRQPRAADNAGAADADVEIADDPPPRQRARPVFQRVELIGGVATADQRTHRCADDNVRRDAVGLQRPHYADVGEAARGAAAENEPDRRPAALDREVAGVDGLVPNLDTTHAVLAY